jgi:hypothetical protein
VRPEAAGVGEEEMRSPYSAAAASTRTMKKRKKMNEIPEGG